VWEETKTRCHHGPFVARKESKKREATRFPGLEEQEQEQKQEQEQEQERCHHHHQHQQQLPLPRQQDEQLLQRSASDYKASSKPTHTL
jgi:hypothetical protein